MKRLTMYIILILLGSYLYFKLIKEGITGVIDEWAFIRRQQEANEKMLREINAPEHNSLQSTWF